MVVAATVDKAKVNTYSTVWCVVYVIIWWTGVLGVLTETIMELGLVLFGLFLLFVAVLAGRAALIEHTDAAFRSAVSTFSPSVVNLHAAAFVLAFTDFGIFCFWAAHTAGALPARAKFTPEGALEFRQQFLAKLAAANFKIF